ncbi:MAG: branched-chain amino acid ABC transporter permease [Thiolinea sp.]
MAETSELLNALVLLGNFVVIPALTYGSQLALGALGVTLVYAVLRFSNFAQGETMAAGAMVTILLTWGLQALGVSLGPLPTALLALPAAIAIIAGVLLLTDRWVYRYYRAKKSASITFMMASIGVMFIMNGVVRFIIGPGDRDFSDGERFIINAREFRNMTGLDEGLALRTSQGLSIVLAIVLVIALFWFLQKTKTGKAMRAYSDNENLALLSGIDPDRVVRITWILAAGLATVAGVLYGLDKGFKPLSYFHLLLPVFAAVIVGGVGKPVGAIAGGFIIAFSEVVITYAYKKLLMYLTPGDWAPEGLVQLLATDYKFAVSFVILVLVLLIRPTGIFKGKVI